MNVQRRQSIDLIIRRVKFFRLKDVKIEGGKRKH